MHEMTETQIQDGRVMVALDAEERRPLLDYWIDMEVGSEFYRYVGYAMPEPRRMSHVRTRRVALLAVMEPKDVALVQRDAYVRCWCKAVEWYSSKPQPLDLGTVKRTHTENRMAPDDPLDAGIYSDPRGYFACLGRVLFEAVAAKIRHDLSGPCDCGPDVTEREDPFSSEDPTSPSHRCERVESLRAADAALAALAEWHART